MQGNTKTNLTLSIYVITRSEWQIFTTAHGKSSSYEVDGTVKRATSRVSFKRPFNDEIIILEDMFNFCNDILSSKIIFFILQHKKSMIKNFFLSERYGLALTISGTQKVHKVIHMTDRRVKTFDITDSSESKGSYIYEKNLSMKK